MQRITTSTFMRGEEVRLPDTVRVLLVRDEKDYTAVTYSEHIPDDAPPPVTH